MNETLYSTDDRLCFTPRLVHPRTSPVEGAYLSTLRASIGLIPKAQEIF